MKLLSRKWSRTGVGIATALVTILAYVLAPQPAAAADDDWAPSMENAGTDSVARYLDFWTAGSGATTYEWLSTREEVWRAGTTNGRFVTDGQQLQTIWWGGYPGTYCLIALPTTLYPSGFMLMVQDCAGIDDRAYWRVILLTGGHLRFENAHWGLCLSGEGPGNAVGLRPCTRTDLLQQWSYFNPGPPR